jgi:hypothetical protein
MIRRSWLFVIVLLLLMTFGCRLSGSDRDDGDDSHPQSLTISGEVDFNGEGLEGVMVTLDGDALLNTTTNSEGEYIFYDVEKSSFRVTPYLEGYEFWPESVDLILADESARVIAFEAYTENNPPELDSIGNITINQGQIFEFVVTAYDADGDRLIYSATPLPYGATLVTEDDYAVFEWVPVDGLTGSYDIAFTVTDDGIPNLNDSETVTLTILGDDNDPGFPSVDNFSERGSFSTTMTSQDGPNGAFSLYYPEDLGRDGLKHPIITWGNGTGAIPVFYGGLLDHWASHGFVVIASNSTMTGSGEEMLRGVDWLISESSSEGSLFFNKISVNAVGASGHSQGGGGTINAGHNPKVKCTAPIQPTPENAKDLQGPMFVIAGSNDTIIAPELVSQVYASSNVPTVFGILEGASHFTPVGSAQGMRGYLTAWFRWHLMGDESARDLFYGDNCGICNDSAWTVERKNL